MSAVWVFDRKLDWRARCCPDSNGGPTDYESCVEMNRIKDLESQL